MRRRDARSSLRRLDPDGAASFPIGETAAVTAATFWAAGSFLFASAARRAGPWAVNQFRLFAATALLAVTFLAGGLLHGFEALPPWRQSLLLLASGVVGLVLAYPLVNLGVGRFLEETMPAYFPYFRIDPVTAVSAVLLAVLLGVASAAIPAFTASRLTVAGSLRRVD